MYQPSYSTDHLFFPSLPSQHDNQTEDFQDFLKPNLPYPFLQRSISSSFSFNQNGVETTHARRVFSTGDIHNFSCDSNMSVIHPPPESVDQSDHLQQSSHSGAGSISSSAGRVGRYNAEERRGRIERYRNKRNHRNFQKKITYACRKTLADRRPRVHGRFARSNESTEVENINHDEHIRQQLVHHEEEEEEGLKSSMQTNVEEQDYYGCDGELTWANFLDALNMNSIIS